MKTPVTGERIERIYWPPKPSGQHDSLVATETDTLVYQEIYHGDRSDCWVVANVNGVEAARHNVKYLESIVWLTPAAKAP